jgi:hypothetical protein
MADERGEAPCVRPPGNEEVAKNTMGPGKSQRSRTEEDCDVGLQEWLVVEEDLGKDWVSVVTKRP